MNHFFFRKCKRIEIRDSQRSESHKNGTYPRAKMTPGHERLMGKSYSFTATAFLGQIIGCLATLL